MFAILLSKDMEPFYQTIASFPTIIFTVLLGLVLFYWLVAVIGLVDIDFLDIDADVDAGDSVSGPNALAGLLMRFGLGGVPVTISLSIVIIVGWFVCYYGAYMLLPLADDYVSSLGSIAAAVIRYALGVPLFFGSLYVGLKVASLLIKPLRPLFVTAQQKTSDRVLGQVAIVRTSRVDQSFGEATLSDGGAGLVLQVRATAGQTLERHARVIPIEYLEEKNAYRVVLESEFLDSSTTDND